MPENDTGKYFLKRETFSPQKTLKSFVLLGKTSNIST